jgi:hypothetical protein
MADLVRTEILKGQKARGPLPLMTTDIGPINNIHTFYQVFLIQLQELRMSVQEMQAGRV